MAGKIGGTTHVQVDGEVISVGSRVRVKRGVQREARTGLDGTVHMVESPQAAEFEIEVLSASETDLEKLHAVTDGTITVQANNGVQHILRNAFSANPIDEDLAEGNSTLLYIGVYDSV